MHVGLRGTGGAAFIVCSLLLTAGCETGGGRHTSEGKHPEKRSASPSPSPSPSPTPSPLTAAQVKAALLTPADLPSGWRKDRAFPENDNAGAYEFQIAVAEDTDCQPALDTAIGSDYGPKADSIAVRAFTKGSQGPDLLTAVATFLPDDAKEMVDASTLPEDCTDFAAKEQEFGKVRVRYRKLDLPDLGDASLGTRVRVIPADKNLYSVQFDNAIVRVGGTVVNVSMLSYTTTDRASFDQAVRTAVDKVTSTAKPSTEA